MRLINDRTNTQTNRPKRQSSPEKTSYEEKVTTGGQKIVRKHRPEKLSKSEVRAKLRARAEEQEAAKVAVDAKRAESMKANKGDQVVADVKITPDGEPIGDIKKNDPNDTNVHEKLKGALTAGTFNFSDKEREVLGKILG